MPSQMRGMAFAGVPDCLDRIRPDAGGGKAVTDADAWLWVIDALAAELAEVPAAARSTLVARLVAKAGYAAADTDYDPARRTRDARVRLVTALAARIAA